MRATVAAFVGILLGTLLSQACAQTTISTPQFELTASGRQVLTRLELVSHTESETRLQLTDMNRTSRITSLPYPDVFYDVIQLYALDVQVQPGYQITGFTMGLEASAAAVHNPRAEWKGAADITPYQIFFARDGMVLGSASATSLRPDAHALLAATQDISLTGQFDYPTYLDLSQSGAYFTIHTAPVAAVPEPGAWLLLLAGTGLLAGTTFRRRARTAPHISAGVVGCERFQQPHPWSGAMRTITAFLLAVSLSGFLADTQAQTSISTPVLDVRTRPGGYTDNFSLLSQTAYETRLSLAGLDGVTRVQSIRGFPTVDYLSQFMQFLTVNVDPAYRVTGIQLSASADARATVSDDPRIDQPGYAAVDQFHLTLSVAVPPDTYHVAMADVDNVTAPQSVEGTVSQSLSGQFDVSALFLWAIRLDGGRSYHSYEPGTGTELYFPSYLDLNQSNTVLTFYTVPVNAVPEPASAAMCLAGLILLLATRRRCVPAD